MNAIRGRFGQKHAAAAGIFVVTMLGLLAVGATLPVLPRYVKGPINAGDLEVGIVSGAFAITGLAFRPLAGRLADRRGRRLTVMGGALLTAIAGALYFVPAGVPGLVAARLVLGMGEGAVFTAGSAWIVGLAPPDRRGRILGLYGLSIWGGLTLGPPLGELLLRAASFDLVWAFAAGAPLLGVLIASRIPESYTPVTPRERVPFIAPEAVRPGIALSLGIIGFASVAAFLVLHLDDRGVGHGATAFSAFAATVVIARLVGGNLPDRFGGARVAAWCAVIEAIGLVLLAEADSLAVALAGAISMGGAFSLLYPSLALMVVERVPEERRGSALGTFTACFDLGIGVGSPIVGLAASLGGYEAAFLLGAAFSLCVIPAAVAASRAAPLLGPAAASAAGAD